MRAATGEDSASKDGNVMSDHSMQTPQQQTQRPEPAATAELDCESAALFRASLSPLFDRAASWAALIEGLALRGYRLAIREARLVLIDTTSGRRVCSARYLGTNLRDLSGRLGRPCVVAQWDRPAAAEFLV